MIPRNLVLRNKGCLILLSVLKKTRYAQRRNAEAGGDIKVAERNWRSVVVNPINLQASLGSDASNMIPSRKLEPSKASCSD